METALSVAASLIGVPSDPHAALILLVIGIYGFIFELATPGHGFGGMIAIVCFGLALLSPHLPAAAHDLFNVSLASTISILIAATIIFAIFMKKALAASRSRPKTGVESMIGMTGTAQTDLAPEGSVFLNGEIWTGVADGPVEKGATVRVTKISGNKIYVQKS